MAQEAWKQAQEAAKNACKKCDCKEMVVEFRCLGSDERKKQLQRLRDLRVSKAQKMTDEAKKKYGLENMDQTIPNCGDKLKIKCDDYKK